MLQPLWHVSELAVAAQQVSQCEHRLQIEFLVAIVARLSNTLPAFFLGRVFSACAAAGHCCELLMVIVLLVL